jgi:hypothetical protein
MGTLTVGKPIVSLGTYTPAGTTNVDYGYPASGTGIVTELRCQLLSGLTVEVGVFTIAAGPSLTTTWNGSVTFTSGNPEIASGLSIPIAAGQFLGMYHGTARMGCASNVYDPPLGLWRKTGDYVPCTNQGTWTDITDRSLVLYGTGYTVPQIASLSAYSGHVGDSITISGSQFGAAGGGVTLNGDACSVTSWSDTSIVITIPAGATSGDIVVTDSGGRSSAGVAFTVTVAVGRSFVVICG